MKSSIPKDIYKELAKKLDASSLKNDELSKIAFAADAGCYQKIPQLVITSKNEEEIIYVLNLLNQHHIPVTFRAAGTSLSGQSISDSVLLQARGDHWSNIQISDGGQRVRTQVGISGNRLNQLLKPYQRKFGPDPASINSALIGGIIANNASGMSCGTHANAYATIESARIIFADGTLLDTSNETSISDFIKSHPLFIETIEKLRNQLIESEDKINFIKSKYSIKNTTGYSLNAFIDFYHPIEIILHLMVGSEGTLGFISEATFKTIPVLPFRASSMIYFPSLSEACQAVPLLRSARVSAIELLDREALRSVENKPGIPNYIKEFNHEVTALLIDIEALTLDELEHLMVSVRKVLTAFSLIRDFEVTHDTRQINEFWKIRKGVFPSVGGKRRPGTTVIIEDVAVKMEFLTEAVLDLRNLLNRLGFSEAVIYGHALDGNLHFIVSPDFSNADELNNYRTLIDELTRLIVDKYQGSLKAEHGTGINMAPFVKYEWGNELYEVMKKIKHLFDPNGILNPGVIINDDPEVHLKNFKPMPLVDETVDACIECGFCEINCLSTGYTLSARQRIVVQREIARLTAIQENDSLKKMIEKSFQFMGNESCAGDGLCATSCPLSIDTGVFIKKYRNFRNASNISAQNMAVRIANNFDTTQKLVRTGLGIVSLSNRVLGDKVFGGIASGLRVATLNTIPEWNPYLPQPAKKQQVKPIQKESQAPKVVYFPSCINQTMGPSKKDNQHKPLIQVTVEVIERAGYQVIFPEKMNTLCCGTPWESKGFLKVANQKSSELEMALLLASNQGEYPVLCDTSPCIYRMRMVMDKKLKLYEPVEFIHDYLLEKLPLKKTSQKLAFHVTCSSIKMDITEKFIKVAQACTQHPVFPDEVGCCGFAGDKGFTQPALNNWSLRKLKPQVKSCQNGFSNSRTCEIGLSKNSGISYQSVMYLLHECIE